MAQQKITFNEVSTNTAIVTSQLDSASANGTGAILVPSGTTAQRPSATTSGYIRFNTTLGSLESANGTAWANVGSGSAGSGGVSWTPTVQNTSFVAVKNSGYFVNTATGSITVTLPSTPIVGDNITFVDYGGQLSSNALIFYPNGNKINANTINVSVITSTASIGLVYSDNNKGWIAYDGFVTSPIGSYTVEYLIVAGGGGGGSGLAGGGGAGGVLSAITTINPGTNYTISVGSGGAGGTAGSYNLGNSGSNSSGFGALALGGGGAGAYNINGLSGGCGGGGGTADGAVPATRSGGAGTSGQGYAGGSGNPPAQDAYAGGGGGGSAAVGSPSSGRNAGPGGSGLASSISGSSVYYAGGGGGSAYSPQSGVAGTGGAGGGTDGSLLGVSSSGTANRGGGSGGGGYNAGALGAGSGGSGIVIVRYLGPQRANGGTITQSGGYTIHTFTSSGTFTA